MSFLKYLIEHSEDEITILQEFLLNKKNEKPSLHIFTEGTYDVPVYKNQLNKILPKQNGYLLFSYVCGNKNKVYSAFEDIKSNLDNTHQGLFFVDKDLDDLIPVDYPNIPQIYVTNHYAIENYLVNKKTLVDVYEDIFKQGVGAFGKDYLIKQFEKSRKDFYEYCIKIMAWYLYHRRNDRTPILGNVKLNDLYHIEDDLTVDFILQRDLEEYLDKNCDVTTGDDWLECKQEIVNELKESKYKSVIRGKFEMWFFVKFLRKVREILETYLKSKGESFKVNINIAQSNASIIFAPRIDKIKSIENYVTSQIN